MTVGLDQIVAEAATLLRASATAEHDRRTDLLREVAGLFVDLRSQIRTPTGEPDWTARTGRYRDLVSQVFSRAQLTPEERSKAAAAIRYHTSAVLRDRLSEEEIVDLGLRPETTRERSIEKRQNQRALLSALQHADDGPPIELLHALSGAYNLLRRADAESWADLTPARQAHAEMVLDGIVSELNRLDRRRRGQRRRRGSAS